MEPPRPVGAQIVVVLVLSLHRKATTICMAHALCLGCARVVSSVGSSDSWSSGKRQAASGSYSTGKRSSGSYSTGKRSSGSYSTVQLLYHRFNLNHSSGYKYSHCVSTLSVSGDSWLFSGSSVASKQRHDRHPPCLTGINTPGSGALSAGQTSDRSL